jgi:2-polyprenyl-3-methyl-5-hydroxy-6-metoxy-1,4-benzoquinol methylase
MYKLFPPDKILAYEITVNSLQLRHYPESRFGGFTSLDGTIAFYSRVNELVRPEHTVLDIGCGVGVYGQDNVRIRRDLRILKGKAARVIGIDVDSAAAANPFLDDFRSITSATWPIEDASIDVALADWVLEHVSDPDAFFAECARVVRPGGYLCMRTANLYSYTGVAAALIPNRWHERVIRATKMQRAEGDVFPTRYRCNTIWAIRRHLRRAGFAAVVLGVHAEPTYLSFGRAPYWLGTLYSRLAPRAFAPAITCFAQREHQ